MPKHEEFDAGGIHITSYTGENAFDEMMADEAEAHAQAVENMTPSQRAIPLGGYACNILHLNDGSDIGPIFGAVQSVEEVRAWHELYYGAGNREDNLAVLAVRGLFDPPNYPKDPESKAWEDDGFESAEAAVADAVARHLGAWGDGYLFGHWFSGMEPGGELGSAHASVCVQVDEVTFREAQAHGGLVSQEGAIKISAAMRVIAEEYKAREGEPEGEGDDSHR